jgi:hypothetical protein
MKKLEENLDIPRMTKEEWGKKFMNFLKLL